MRHVLSLTLIVVALAVVPAGAHAKSSGLALSKPSRAALADGAKLRVAIPASKARGGRVVIGLASPRGRALKVRTLRVPTRRGTRRVIRRLTLSRAARRRLAACRAYTLTVRLVRRNGRTVARTRRALPATAGCRGGRSSAKAPVAPGFDTADFDTCDALDPAVCLQPFPSNHFSRGAADRKRVQFPREAMPKNRAGKEIEPSDYAFSDGFSPGSKLITKVPGLDTIDAFRATGAPAIDDPAASQAANSPVVVINAETGAKHLVWSELDINPRDERKGDRNLLIRPAVNFDEGTRYIVALRRMRRADGSIIPPTRAFEVYRDRIITTDAKVEGRRAAMEGIFKTLGKAGVARDDLYLAWDFTTATAKSTTSRLLHIRDQAFAELGDTNLANRTVEGKAPTFEVLPDLPDSPLTADTDGVQNFPEGKIARRVRGVITIPCFLGPSCANKGRFVFEDADGRKPRRFGVTTQQFTCNIPRRALGETPEQVKPGLYGHGLFGGQGEADGGQLSDFAQEHGFGFCAVDWAGMATKDVPTALTILQELSQFPELTDHVQQGILNFLYMGRAMVHPQGLRTHPAFQSTPGTSVFDPTSRLTYDGNSQGGIYGGTLAAVGVDHDRVVLGVPGQNYSTLLRRSVDFDGYAEGSFGGVDSEAGLYDQYPNQLERPLVLALIQMLWDRSDPNGYAHHMTDDPLPNTPPHTVLLHPAFGDHQVADVAATVMARTVGAKLHTPVLENGRPRFRDLPYPGRPDNSFVGLDPMPDGHTGSGMVLWDIGPMREGGKGTPPPPAGNVPPREGKDPHSAPRSSVDGREQKARFLKDGLIPDVCGGPCFADNYTGAAAGG